MHRDCVTRARILYVVHMALCLCVLLCGAWAVCFCGTCVMTAHMCGMYDVLVCFTHALCKWCDGHGCIVCVWFMCVC